MPAAAAWSMALMLGLLIGTLKQMAPSSEANITAYSNFINPLTKVTSP